MLNLDKRTHEEASVSLRWVIGTPVFPLLETWQEAEALRILSEGLTLS